MLETAHTADLAPKFGAKGRGRKKMAGYVNLTITSSLSSFASEKRFQKSITVLSLKVRVRSLFIISVIVGNTASTDCQL